MRKHAGRWGVGIVALLALAVSAQALPITLTQISTPFPTPIGIDYHEPTNSVVMSVNYASGLPHNFRRVQQDGTQVQWSTISGLTNEVKIATARSVSGSFAAGTMFTGTGVSGQIFSVSPDGTIAGLFANLGNVGLMRGSLYVDRTGVYGGDLIAVTTGGFVYRVNQAGVGTQIASVGTHLEGVITVPNLPSYGPLAGKIIAGAENSGLMYVFDNNGFVATHNLGVNIEDIDLITGTENFFGVNFGTSKLLGSAAGDWAGAAGDILLTQEFPAAGTTGLWTLEWDPNAGGGAGALVATPVTLNAGSAPVGQWEHVTFAAAGINEIPPTGGIPEPGTMMLFAFGLGGGVVFLRRRRNR